MERVIELIFDYFVKEICGEGERRIKLQALTVALSAVLGIRRLFVLVFFYCFACFLAALSFFGALFVAVEQKLSGSFNYLDPRLDVCVGVFVVSTLALFLSVREKSWSGAFGIQNKINEIENAPQKGFSEADVVGLVERAVRSALDERDRAAQAAKADAPQVETPEKAS